jgi:hypothetical protein
MTQVNKYDSIKTAFDSLISHPQFQLLVREYRFRFGIPPDGFVDTTSTGYRNWISEAERKSDYLKDQFLFIAKRCRNLIPDKDPVKYVALSYYFLFNKYPVKDLDEKDYKFIIDPSGFLGNFETSLIVPFSFEKEEFLKQVNNNIAQIEKIIHDSKKVILKLKSRRNKKTSYDNKKDMLATTPANGAGLVDRSQRDQNHLIELGRIGLREHLYSMKDDDFVINKYEDKNKPISAPIGQMGMFLMNRGMYSLSEEYWKNIDDEILVFNKSTGRNINRGIPLANMGVNQIAQGKIIEGLFNIYRGYENDKNTLQHLPEIIIDPEKNMAESILFRQFEEIQTSKLFDLIISKFSDVFVTPISRTQLSTFIQNLKSDKKLLLYMILYRFSFSLSLNSELTNVISRSELQRSLSELALWYEDELKRKDLKLNGHTLVEILDQKIGKTNPRHGQFTKASSLDELMLKMSDTLSAGGSLEIVNSRIMGCMRNFSNHNLEVNDHKFFDYCEEIFARMFSLIIYSNSQHWI